MHERVTYPGLLGKSLRSDRQAMNKKGVSPDRSGESNFSSGGRTLEREDCIAKLRTRHQTDEADYVQYSPTVK